MFNIFSDLQVNVVYSTFKERIKGQMHEENAERLRRNKEAANKLKGN